MATYKHDTRYIDSKLSANGEDYFQLMNISNDDLYYFVGARIRLWIDSRYMGRRMRILVSKYTGSSPSMIDNRGSVTESSDIPISEVHWLQGQRMQFIEKDINYKMQLQNGDKLAVYFVYNGPKPYVYGSVLINYFHNANRSS